MKKKDFPEPTKQEVASVVLKTETIQMRLTETEKKEIRETAESFHLSLTEYLLKCHAVVAANRAGEKSEPGFFADHEGGNA